MQLSNYIHENETFLKGDIRLVGQEVTKVRYSFHKSAPPVVPILSHLNPVHTFPPCFPKIHSNIILPSMPNSPKRFFLKMFQLKLCLHFLSPHVFYMSHPSHFPSFGRTNIVVKNTNYEIAQRFAFRHPESLFFP
jgi:hypothetical protein